MKYFGLLAKRIHFALVISKACGMRSFSTIRGIGFGILCLDTLRSNTRNRDFDGTVPNRIYGPGRFDMI